MPPSRRKQAKPVPSRRAFPRLLRLLRCEDGTAAIEFSIVAMPFFLLTFAILQTGLIYFATQVLETAAADSARLIMTGEAQTQNMTKDQFKTAVCARAYSIFDCASRLYVDVRTFPTFGLPADSPLDASGNVDSGSMQYAPGGPGDIVVVRVFYRWPVVVPTLGLANMAGDNRLLVATAAFRNEPYL